MIKQQHLLKLCLIFFCAICVATFASIAAEQVELTPKMVRWPTHIDHYLCKQLHNGIGLRSHAVTNLNGDLCRTYCRIIDRMAGKITYTENVTPNFVRCGANQARCVDGNCVGLNFPSVSAGSLATEPPIPPESVTSDGASSFEPAESLEPERPVEPNVDQPESAAVQSNSDDTTTVTTMRTPQQTENLIHSS